jgi:hypothetical protein
MKNNTIEDVHYLIALSQTMLKNAHDESWDDVFILEAERGELIKLFFLEPVQQLHVAEIANGIQAIIEIDRDLLALGKLKKFELAKILHNMDQGKKAVKAYDMTFTDS